MPYCHKCGAQTTENDIFCPRCGVALKATEAGTRPYGRYQRREKSEKGEKHEKREKQEKDEKGGGSRASSLTGGVILIWLGLSLFITQFGYAPWNRWWGYFVLGLGAIVIIRGILAAAETRRMGPAYGSVFGGLLLCMLGAWGILGLRDWWPMLIVLLGVTIVIAALIEMTRNPRPRGTT